MALLLPSEVGLDKARSYRIIFSLHQTIVYFLLLLSIGGRSDHRHNIFLLFRRGRQWWERFHRWPRRLFLDDCGQLLNLLIVLARDFEGALGTTAIVNQVSFD